MKPTFTGRISEIKCKEHIWQVKYETEKAIQLKKCKKKERKSKVNVIKASDKTGTVPRIGGATITSKGEFLHMGAIGWRTKTSTWAFNCGCSIISPQYVITAAHCSRASPTDTTLADLEPKIVRAGNNNIQNPPFIDLKILRIITHPNYQSPSKYNDIALMELEKTIQFNRVIQPACLWTRSDLKESGNRATISGWGASTEDSLVGSPDLKAANVDVLDDALCNRTLSVITNRNWAGISNHQVCAGNLTGGPDSCQGDSGIPLQVKILLPETFTYNLYYIYGVASFGKGCTRPKLPGIYTKVSSFLDWIEPIVWT